MIFFDIDGTLIDHLGASAAASLALFDKYPGEIPFAREEFPAIWEFIMDRYFDRFCRGELSIWEQRRARMRDSFGAPKFSDAEADERYYVFIEEYERLTTAYEDAAPCLEKLANQPLGIISNGAREQQIAKLDRAGLLPYFSVMVFSEDTGFGKPHPSIFQEACRRAGQDASNCVHIGDDLTNDVFASHEFGIRPVWVDRHNRRTKVPGRRITSLNELCAEPDGHSTKADKELGQISLA